MTNLSLKHLPFIFVGLAGCGASLTGADANHGASDGGPDVGSAPMDARAPLPDADAPDAGPVPSDADAPQDVADAPAAQDARVDAGMCPPRGAAPSARLNSLYDSVIRTGCVGAGRFCHGESVHFPAQFTMLSAEQTIDALVNVRGCRGVDVRVVPCRPEASHLLDLLRRPQNPCGNSVGVFVSGSHPTFSPEQVAAFEAWILEGAN